MREAVARDEQRRDHQNVKFEKTMFKLPPQSFHPAAITLLTTGRPGECVIRRRGADAMAVRGARKCGVSARVARSGDCGGAAPYRANRFIVVPIAAGSVTDVIMRAASQELSARLGQPLVIDNRTGERHHRRRGVREATPTAIRLRNLPYHLGQPVNVRQAAVRPRNGFCCDPHLYYVTGRWWFLPRCRLTRSLTCARW